MVVLLWGCGGRSVQVPADDGGQVDQGSIPADLAAPPVDRARPDGAVPPLADAGPIMPDGPQRPCAASLASVHKAINNKMVVCRAAQGS